MSWCAPAWVGQSDEEYKKMLQRKAVAVTRRDKRRGGQYTVKQALEAINEAFHRCNGFDPYDGSKLDPELIGTYSNERSKKSGAAYKREMDSDNISAPSFPIASFVLISANRNLASPQRSYDLYQQLQIIYS